MIRKIVITDTLSGDTTVISREQLRVAAKEFLDIPDLSVKKIAKRYKEETARYDDMLNRVVIEYNAIKPSEEYKNQQILILPDNGSGDIVTNIIVTTEVTKDDVMTHKNLLWQMDKSFQITTTTQKKGGGEQTIITKVIWNEDN